MLKNNYRNNRGRVRSVSRANETRLKAGLPELGISLRKRRIWWADDPSEDGDGGSGGDDPKYDPKDLEEAKRIIDSLVKRVDERKAENEALRSSQDQLAERIDVMEKASRKKSEQDGDFERLYNEQLVANENLRQQADRSKSLEQVIRESNDKRIASIPELMRGIVPVDYSPEKLQAWLNTNEATLVRQPAPNYDGGVGGNGGDLNPKLSPDEIEAGRLMGLTEEDLLKAKGDES